MLIICRLASLVDSLIPASFSSALFRIAHAASHLRVREHFSAAAASANIAGRANMALCTADARSATHCPALGGSIGGLLSRLFIVTLRVVVFIEMDEHVGQLADSADRLVKLLLQEDHLLVRVIPVVLLQRLHPVLGRLHLRQRLTRLINVVNRAYNLANLLLVLVLILDLVLKIEL